MCHHSGAFPHGRPPGQGPLAVPPRDQGWPLVLPRRAIRCSQLAVHSYSMSAYGDYAISYAVHLLLYGVLGVRLLANGHKDTSCPMTAVVSGPETMVPL